MRASIRLTSGSAPSCGADRLLARRPSTFWRFTHIILSNSGPGSSYYLALYRPFTSANMTSRAALLIGKITHARKEWEALSSLLELKEYGTGSRQDFLSQLKDGKYDDVVAIYRSNDSTSVTGLFDKELVTALPKSLKFITHNGAGYDNIDVPACSERNIDISSTPIAVNDATADS